MVLRTALSTALLISFPAIGAQLTVELTDVDNKDGVVCFSLFNSEEGFPDDAELVQKYECASASEAVGGNLTTTFDVDEGNWAIALFHDENENGKLDTTGIFNIPSEGIGFSNNPSITPAGAPSFDTCKFAIDGDATVTIKAKYLLR